MVPKLCSNFAKFLGKIFLGIEIADCVPQQFILTRCLFTYFIHKRAVKYCVYKFITLPCFALSCEIINLVLVFMFFSTFCVQQLRGNNLRGNTYNTS